MTMPPRAIRRRWIATMRGEYSLIVCMKRAIQNPMIGKARYPRSKMIITREKLRSFQISMGTRGY